MQHSRPSISIITPTFNAGKHIAQCLSSVQDQTFRNFEHLILDGGSTDGTIDTVKTHVNHHTNIRLYVDRDQGIYDAMNKGIAQAGGDWLYFLGADDALMDSHVLEKMWPFLAQAKAQFIYGNVFFQSLGRDYDHEFDMEKILKRNICHQAIFYHQSIFKIIGLYDFHYKTQADYDLNLRSWLSGRINHGYAPVTIASYSEGGLSSLQPDGLFKADFPKRSIAALLTGEMTGPNKIQILSKIFRKILLRYGFIDLLRHVFVSPQVFTRLSSFFWMCLTSPVYLLKKKN